MAVVVDMSGVRTQGAFIERVLGAVESDPALRTPSWDAFEEQVREQGRVVRLEDLDFEAGEIQLGVQILDENGLLE